MLPTDVDARLECALLDHDKSMAVVRLIAGTGTATDETTAGFTGAELIEAAQTSRATWNLERKMIDAAEGFVAHVRGNPLPALACSRLGTPPK